MVGRNRRVETYHHLFAPLRGSADRHHVASKLGSRPAGRHRPTASTREGGLPARSAPTTSTTIQLAIGDSLAIALLDARGFTALDFKIFHPGGSLGAQLKFVADLMHKGERLPLVPEFIVMGEALVIMTEKSFGCLGVVDGADKLIGMITDAVFAATWVLS